MLTRVENNAKRQDRMDELTQALYELVDKHDLTDVLTALSYVCDEEAQCVRYCKEEGAWLHAQGTLRRLSDDPQVQDIAVLTEEEKG